MADKLISALTAATTVGVADLGIIETSGGNSRKVTTGKLGTGFGTSFPGSPTTEDRFYRTDRHIEYYYDGTRWLSTQLFTLTATSVSNVSVTTSVNLPVPYSGTYDLWLERFDTTSLRSAAGEWDIVLQWTTAANVATVLTTIDGNGDTASNWYAKSATIGSVLSSTARQFQVNYSEISGSATFYGNAALFYRLVG